MAWNNTKTITPVNSDLRMQSLQKLGFVYLGMFILGVGQSIEFAVMPMIGRALGLHELIIEIPALGIYYAPKELAITVLASVTALSFSACTPFWGRLSDSIGRKPLIVFGFVGYCLGVWLFCLAAYLGFKGMVLGWGLFALLFAARTIHSAMKSAAFPSSNAYVIDTVDITHRTKALGGLASSTQIGSMCGPILAFLVVVHFLFPLILQGILCLVMAIILWFYLTNSQETNVSGKPKAQPMAQKLKYLDKRYRAYTVLCFLIYLSMGMVQQTLGFYFQDILQITTSQAAKYYSLSMMVSSAAMLFAQLAIVQRIQKAAAFFIYIGLPVLALSFFSISQSQTLLHLLISMGLFGFAVGLIGPSLASAASQKVSEDEQGGLSGIISSVSGLGFVIGPLVGGLIYGYNPRAVYILAAVCVCCLIIQLIIKTYFFSEKKLA